jgi:iron complex outermembrane receptor protein
VHLQLQEFVMPRRVLRAFMLGCSSLIVVCDGPAIAQDTLDLPEIRVTAPSPIQRRRPARPATATAPAAPSAPAAPAEPALAGTLPIVTDQFATVTVMPREEIARTPGSTLGDVLFAKPGITGSSFAPGASSRPIIRGLDVNRVGIVDNGVGAGGASDLGEDHFVPVNPLATDRIEVIRGPATLRYGSQSIGGVVSSTNNRVPDALPCGPFSPLNPARGYYKAPQITPARAGCTTVEGRAALSSVDNGREGGLLLDSGAGNFAFHADAFGRGSEDYRVPSYPYLTPPDPADLPFATQPEAFNGRQPNSWTRSNEYSVGGSYFFQGGFAGIAYVRNNNRYGIPGPEPESNRVYIDGHQDKVIGKGEFRPPGGAVDAVRYWWGYTDYKHHEIGASEDDPSIDIIHQTFTNKELEGRVEVQLAPFNLRFAELTTAIGLQAGNQRLTAPGDDPANVLGGLFDPNKNHRVAGYIFNEFKFSETTKAQIAGRVEQVNLRGSTPSFLAPVFDAADPATVGPATQRDLEFMPKSVSAGLIQNLPWGLVGSVTGQYVERAPKPAELFSRGPHEATETFDIGDPNLKTEVANSVEVGLRRAGGPFRFEATAYYTRFNGFIFRGLTGATCDETTCGMGVGELNEARYSQRDATFRGGEFQFQWDTLPMWQGFWGIDGQYDIVRATFTDGTNVPRIPPQRVGGGVYYRNAEWFGRISLLHAFAQNDIAVVGETPTTGYNLLKVEVSHTRELKNDPTGIKKVTIGVVGNNLLNDDIRNHVSYNKDVVLMPGAGVRAFASVKY